MAANIDTVPLHEARASFARDGSVAFDPLTAALRHLQRDAEQATHEDLARVCRVAAEALQRVVGEADATERHGSRILQHLDLLIDYAGALARGDARVPLPPPLLSLPDPTEERHLRDTIAVFVGNALGVVSELEEEILAVESGTHAEDSVAAIRRIVHTLKAEFGVLQLAQAQRLCHDAETAIDACTERGRAFPVDLMLALADWLQQYLDVLGRDPTGPVPPWQDLQQRLQQEQLAPGFAAGVVADGAAVAAAGASVEAAADRDAGESDPSASGQAAVDAGENDAREGGVGEDDVVEARAVEGGGPGAPPMGAAAVTGAAAPTAGPSVVLRVEGEFADSLNEFLTEARSHLTDAEAALLELDSGSDDGEPINRTFRAFHTIKGVAGFLGLAPIVDLAHIAETVLDEARSGRLQLSQAAVDLLLAAGDFVQRMLSSLEGAASPPLAEFEALATRLRATAVGRAEAVSQAAPGSGSPGGAEPAGAVADEPDGEDAGTAAAPQAPVLQPVASARAPAAVSGGTGDAAAGAGALGAGAAPAASRPAVGEETRAAKVERSVKVNTARLDTLVDMVGELVIAQSMVLQHPAIAGLTDQALTRNIGQVGKITRDLQEAAMSLRMVTVKATFQKMARLVRDVASKSGKRVNLTIQGEDTELDRTVVEQISDPLVHMIRNAVDHGIEPIDARRRNGKPDDGRLLLRAYHQGGSIVIEIRDDGRGIDKQRVVQKAIEKGLVSPSTRAEDLPDQEAFGMIFLPGFSTAEKVTDLSGRGVGMDVVRRNIEALRGKIEIDSRLGQGTVFRMRLPLTLAIIDGMVLRVGRERYVLPTMSIEQSFLCQQEDVHYLADRGECVRVRGEVLPVYRLGEVFGIADAAGELTEGILVTVETDGDRSCLFVDEILGQQQVVIKSLGDNRVCGVSGGAIMSDGRVALILDVGAVIQAAVAV